MTISLPSREPTAECEKRERQPFVEVIPIERRQWLHFEGAIDRKGRSVRLLPQQRRDAEGPRD